MGAGPRHALPKSAQMQGLLREEDQPAGHAGSTAMQIGLVLENEGFIAQAAERLLEDVLFARVEAGVAVPLAIYLRYTSYLIEMRR